MSLRFAASDVGSTIYVIAGDKKKAQAWIRRQATPARYQHIGKDAVPGGAVIVALVSTLPPETKAWLREIARGGAATVREVFG